jgi:myo-inositol 2-dehydrogenase/D-chiro-inositol 1-dehydrogenase
MVLGVGVIGAGVMGAAHARILARQVGGARLIAISDPDRSRAEAVVAETSAGRVADDGQALIADPEVQAVLVASPDHTHAEFVLACIKAGKPVLCEKPLAASPEECLRVIEAEIASGRKLVQVGFMRRFDPAYVEMKSALDGGRLGRPLLMHCVHRNAVIPSFFLEGMIISNAVVHEIDIAKFLLGGSIIRARVFRPPAGSAVSDRELVLLLLENDAGQLIDIEAFMAAGYGYDIRGEIVCEHGTVTMQPPVNVQVRHETREAFGFATDWRARFAEAYRLQLQGWVDAIAAGRQVGASAWDGYEATAVAGACLEALARGEPVDVRLERQPAFYA